MLNKISAISDYYVVHIHMISPAIKPNIRYSILDLYKPIDIFRHFIKQMNRNNIIKMH